MVERKTRLRGAQVLANSIQASDLSGTGEVVGNVATVQGDNTIAYDAPVAGTPTSIQDTDGDTKVETEKNADEDIIRFTAFSTQEAQVDVNGLTLKTGASVNEFSTDGTLSGNSDDAVPTEQAVKTFVEAFKSTDLNLTGQIAEDIPIFDGTNWLAKGATEKIFVGNFTRDLSLATGTQAITGVGFKPSYILLFAGVNSTGAVSFGFSDNVNAEGSVYNIHEQDADDWETSVSAFANIRTGVGGEGQAVVINSFDSDGFTLGWTKSGSPTGTAQMRFTAFR